jgi:hypothetical protein
LGVIDDRTGVDARDFADDPAALDIRCIMVQM